MRRSMVALAAAVSGLCIATPSGAAPITFFFEGVVDIAQGPLLDELLGPGVTAADLLGTTFHGTYTFDPDAPDTNGSPNIGAFASSGAPFGMEFHFDHRSFSFDEIDIGVVDDFDIPNVTPGELDDIYAVQSTPLPHPTDPILSTRGRLDLLISDLLPPAALSSDALPLTPPDIASFERARVFVNVLREEEEDGEIVSRVRAGLGGTLLVLRVPAPSALLLVSTGLAVLGMVPRRRRR